LALVIFASFVPLYGVFWGRLHGGNAMATIEMEVRGGYEWKSPVRKLLAFFRRSRDRWKAKYMAKRDACKLMGNQVRAVEKSRAKWRKAAEQAQAQVRELQRELEQNKNSAL
jgi:hypothetical protein